jgi:hypothetical protein
VAGATLLSDGLIEDDTADRCDSSLAAGRNSLEADMVDVRCWVEE